MKSCEFSKLCYEKRFKSKYKLELHLLAHTGETPHQCPYCEKSFPIKHNLYVHQRIHKERTHQCTQCEAEFEKIEVFQIYFLENSDFV